MPPMATIDIFAVLSAARRTNAKMTISVFIKTLK
jgi:hypothetical protein